MLTPTACLLWLIIGACGHKTNFPNNKDVPKGKPLTSTPRHSISQLLLQLKSRKVGCECNDENEGDKVAGMTHCGIKKANIAGDAAARKFQ